MSYSVPFIYITEGGHTAHQGHGRGILWREPNLLPSQTVRQIQPVQHPIPPHHMDLPVEQTTMGGGTSNVDRNNSIQITGDAAKYHGQCVERPTCRSSISEHGL